MGDPNQQHQHDEQHQHDQHDQPGQAGQGAAAFDAGAWSVEHKNKHADHYLATATRDDPSTVYCMSCRAAPGKPPPLLVAYVSITNLVNQHRVDMVEHFTTRKTRGQITDYGSIDLRQLGFDNEWERPMAALWPDEDAVEVYLPGERPVWVDFDAEVGILTRGEDVATTVAQRQFTEDDFWALADAVPWLAGAYDYHARPAEDVAEDEKRRPHPYLDLPLPLEEP